MTLCYKTILKVNLYIVLQALFFTAQMKLMTIDSMNDHCAENADVSSCQNVVGRQNFKADTVKEIDTNDTCIYAAICWTLDP